MTTKMRDREAATITSGIQKQKTREADRTTLSTAELAECTCPEFCERDHDNE